MNRTEGEWVRCPWGRDANKLCGTCGHEFDKHGEYSGCPDDGCSWSTKDTDCECPKFNPYNEPSERNPNSYILMTEPMLGDKFELRGADWYFKLAPRSSCYVPSNQWIRANERMVSMIDKMVKDGKIVARTFND